MKKIFRTLVFAALASTAPFAACSDDETAQLAPSTLLESIRFDLADEVRAKLYIDPTGTEALPLVVGEQIEMGFTTTPSLDEVTFPEMTWTSSNPEVATVADGVVNAIGEGSTVITLSPATFNVNATAAIKLNVVETVVEATAITITDDAVYKDETYDLPACYIGEKMQLTAAIAPDNATYRTVMWRSEDPAVATVDAVKGEVTGVSRGRVKIVARAVDGSGIEASHEIFIDQIITPLGLKITNAPMGKFSIDEGSFTVEFETYPAVSTKSQITWTTSDAAVAEVKNGKVTFKSFGDVTVTASCAASDETLPEGFTREASIQLSIPAGYYNEHFRQETTPWALNPDHVKQGAVGERMYNEDTDEYYWRFTPYLNASKVGRGDVKHAGGTVYLESGGYPILCFRIDDVNDLEAKYSRNINIDTSGNADGVKFSGWIGGNNNKWKTKYLCSDGSAILIYDLATQNFQNGGLLPAGTVGEFTTFQIKYADIKTPAAAADARYRFFWFMTFPSEEDMLTYLQAWSAKTGITYEKK